MSKVFPYHSIQSEPVIIEGASKVKVRWLITKKLGANNFAMRLFEVESGGFSPLHNHPWEHEAFILEGEGQLFNGEDVTPFKAGDVVFVPPEKMHQFINNGKQLLKFICLIPCAKE